MKTLLWSVPIATGAILSSIIYINYQSKSTKPRDDPDSESNICENIDEINESNFQNVYELFLTGFSFSETLTCMLWRQSINDTIPQIKTYLHVKNEIDYISSGLIFYGLTQNNICAIYSSNKPEYLILQLALTVQSMIASTLYDSFGSDAITYIVKLAEFDAIFVDNEKRLRRIVNVLKENKFKIKLIISLINIPKDVLDECENNNFKIVTYQELEMIGRNNPVPHNPSKKHDVYTIYFTSGTSGNPKGVELMHKNFISTVLSLSAFTEKKSNPFSFGIDDILLSYLPAAHIYEGTAELVMVYKGGKIAYYGGNIKEIVNDSQFFKPSIYPTVPRIMNRVYDMTMAALSQSFIKRTIFNIAYYWKRTTLNNGVYNSPLLDKFVFSKIISEKLGGNLRLITTGSAPISPKVLEFWRIVSGACVIQGYGLTETCSSSNLQMTRSIELDTVGKTLHTSTIKFVDVEEMNYFSKDNVGEVCIKGSNVFRGYFKQPELTNEVLIDGWFHTGDIGRLTSSGSLQIVDRKKDIFKLSQGEYIVPHKIENVYNKSPYIIQSVVYGNSLKSYSVCIVVLNFELVRINEYIENAKTLTNLELSKNKKLLNKLLDDLKTLAKENGLLPFEQVKMLLIVLEDFTPENGLLTPTLKLKRYNIIKKYKSEIDKIYV